MNKNTDASDRRAYRAALKSRRQRFLHWLKHDIAKIPEGCRVPRWCIVIRCILFPSHIWYFIRPDDVAYYDWERDVIRVEGMEYSGEIFRAWSTLGLKEGERMEIVKRENGLITFKHLSTQDYLKQQLIHTAPTNTGDTP